MRTHPLRLSLIAAAVLATLPGHALAARVDYTVDLGMERNSNVTMAPVEEGAISPKTSAVPSNMNQVVTSWLLATSPRLIASASFLALGSSVFSDRSGSSAIQRTRSIRWVST